MTNICAATGDAHRWYTPVVQVLGDTNYRRIVYRIRGQFVQSDNVRCWDCQRPAPVGEQEE